MQHNSEFLVRVHRLASKSKWHSLLAAFRAALTKLSALLATATAGGEDAGSSNAASAGGGQAAGDGQRGQQQGASGKKAPVAPEVGSNSLALLLVGMTSPLAFS